MQPDMAGFPLAAARHQIYTIQSQVKTKDYRDQVLAPWLAKREGTERAAAEVVAKRLEDAFARESYAVDLRGIENLPLLKTLPRGLQWERLTQLIVGDDIVFDQTTLRDNANVLLAGWVASAYSEEEYEQRAWVAQQINEVIQKNRESLDLIGMTQISTLPPTLATLTQVETINLAHWTALQRIGNEVFSDNVMNLDLGGCLNLRQVNKWPKRLMMLDIHNCPGLKSGTVPEEWPSTLRLLTYGVQPSLAKNAQPVFPRIPRSVNAIDASTTLDLLDSRVNASRRDVQWSGGVNQVARKQIERLDTKNQILQKKIDTLETELRRQGECINELSAAVAAKQKKKRSIQRVFTCFFPGLKGSPK